MAASADARIAELGLTLPSPPAPMAVYKPAVRVGNLMFLSGHGPLMPDGKLITGRIGQTLTIDEGKAAARQVGLAALATLKSHLGSLDKVKRLVKTLGWVCCTQEFFDQPKVMNGWSELMREVFGEDAGVGARSAVSAHSLPGNMAVEVEAIFEVE